MSNRDDVFDALLTEMLKVARSNIQSGAKAIILLRLAEAYAWVASPAQPHGSSAARSD